jgi:hypothetical protein|tara:strand:- start:551 stop:1429 length:879 start_codon:yes stop_codon:yes gene_type:complete
MAKYIKNETVLITTIYSKGKDFFKYFFDSLKKQTTQNFDLLLANDGVNQSYFLPFLKDIYFESINVSGKISDNRRKLILEAMKNYKKIIFSDSDDFLENNRIELITKMLDKNYIIVNDIDLLNENRSVRKKNYFSKRLKDGCKINIKLLFSGNMMGLSNTAAKVEVFKKCPALLTGDPFAFDWYLWSSILLNNYDAVFTNKTTTKYICRSNSLAELEKFIDAEYIIKVVNLKYKHYCLMKKLDSSFSKLAEEYKNMKEKLNDKIWMKKYILQLKRNSVPNHFWWENIKNKSI